MLQNQFCIFFFKAGDLAKLRKASGKGLDEPLILLTPLELRILGVIGKTVVEGIFTTKIKYINITILNNTFYIAKFYIHLQICKI